MPLLTLTPKQSDQIHIAPQQAKPDFRSKPPVQRPANLSALLQASLRYGRSQATHSRCPLEGSTVQVQVLRGHLCAERAQEVS